MNASQLTSPTAASYAPPIVDRRIEAARNGYTTNVSGEKAFDLARSARANDKSAVSAQLNDHQRKLAGELTAGIESAHQSLDGSVTLSIDPKGALSVDGTPADKAKVGNALAADTTEPRLRDRLASVLQGAKAIASSATQGSGEKAYPDSGASPAYLTVSSQGSSLSYAGALDAQA